MATTATPTQTITTITPPSSSHGHAGGMWEYAVPLEHDDLPQHAQKYSPNNVDSTTNAFSTRRHDSSQRTSNTQSRSTENLSLSSSRVSELRAQPSESNSYSEPDALLENYESNSNNTSRSASYGTTQRVPKKKVTAGTAAVSRSLEDDADNWIHRDKLAQIESKELEAFRVGRRASERQEFGSLSKRQRLASPVHIEADDEEFSTYDPYREDAPSVVSKSFIPKPAGNRAGGSRIPLPRGTASSATPNEQDTTGQSTRSRNGSNGWTGSTAEQGSRSHSNSHSSTNDRPTHLNSPPISPNKASAPASASNSTEGSASARNKNAIKTPPTSLRKTSTGAQRQPSSATKKTGGSGTKSPPESKRPGTSNGMLGAPRPTTSSQRPEGDPPWIVSMYKPDPRLPPDQQMLPTHAKRLAQEKWEKEGKTGTVYDRDFKLLNSEPFPANTRISTIIDSSPEMAKSPDRIQETTLTARWPLSDSTSLGSPRSQSSTRPGTSGTEHGGYKTVPSITNVHATVPVNSPAVQIHPLRTQEIDEDNEKKKVGCCACVIM